MDLVTQFKTWWASIAEKEKSGLIVLGMFFCGALLLTAGVKIGSAIGVLM
ncbi:hypothetical protein [Microbulbifer sp. 2205BS26-8]|nr:hypothetical protein [Microbulbifer sp. 2205BS26-8]MDP5208857.1 hypothetical protein [Microbulbifer sp. 2205BS26-8]